MARPGGARRRRRRPAAAVPRARPARGAGRDRRGVAAVSDPLPEPAGPAAGRVPDPRAVEERANARALHAEGIPMVLAVEDLRPGAAAPTSRDALGEVLADRLETYRAALRPDAADDDEPGGARRGGGAGERARTGRGRDMSFSGHAAALRAGSYLHVVNYHWTPASAADQAEADLAAYLRRFDPVTPEHLDHFVDTGRWPLRRPGFAPVFYDSLPRAGRGRGAGLRVAGHRGVVPAGHRAARRAARRAGGLVRAAPRRPARRACRTTGASASRGTRLAEIGRHHVLGGHTAGHAVPEHTRDPEAVQREARRAVRAADGDRHGGPGGHGVVRGTARRPRRPRVPVDARRRVPVPGQRDPGAACALNRCGQVAPRGGVGHARGRRGGSRTASGSWRRTTPWSTHAAAVPSFVPLRRRAGCRGRGAGRLQRGRSRPARRCDGHRRGRREGQPAAAEGQGDVRLLGRQRRRDQGLPAPQGEVRGGQPRCRGPPRWCRTTASSPASTAACRPATPPTSSASTTRRSASTGSKGTLLDLSPYFSADDVAEFLPPLWQAVQYQGRPYGVPHQTDTSAIVYDTAVLRDAGITTVPDKRRTPGRGRSSRRSRPPCAARLPEQKFPFAYDWTRAGAFRWLVALPGRRHAARPDAGQGGGAERPGDQGARLHQALLHREVGTGVEHDQGRQVLRRVLRVADRADGVRRRLPGADARRPEAGLQGRVGRDVHAAGRRCGVRPRRQRAGGERRDEERRPGGGVRAVRGVRGRDEVLLRAGDRAADAQARWPPRSSTTPSAPTWWRCGRSRRRRSARPSSRSRRCRRSTRSTRCCRSRLEAAFTGQETAQTLQRIGDGVNQALQR
nr:hypothetical protein [Angustibacter aerolatus]